MQPFIKQICGSARSLMRSREPTSSAFISSLNRYLIYLILGSVFSLLLFSIFVVISATKRLFDYTVNTYFHSTNLTYNLNLTNNFKMYILTATLSKITSNYSQPHANYDIEYNGKGLASVVATHWILWINPGVASCWRV